MMPPAIRKILEPNTSLIGERLYAIQEFIGAGYDVHINFSPVIVYDDWLTHYRFLFNNISYVIHQKNWEK